MLRPLSRPFVRRLGVAACVLAILLGQTPLVRAEVTAESVLEAIEKGKRFLISIQQKDGSWATKDGHTYSVGITSLVLLALINSGMAKGDEPVARGLKFLRNVDEPQLTYEISLMIQALTAAKDGQRDTARLISLVRKLEDGQIKNGPNAGGWAYGSVGIGGNLGGGDRSNSQFAVLGLREAQYAGIPVNRKVWELTREYWTSQQSADGGWSYAQSGNASGSGSMTVAGIATMVITESMLHSEKDENADGTPNCCGDGPRDKSLDRAITWMEQHFSVGHNPGGGGWLLYYLYGLERAGRLSGRRFFGDHDWYREGAEFLIRGQAKRLGSWQGDGSVENDPVVGTSFALLFLSKGLAPVLINKLKFHPAGAKPGSEPWNLHPHDVRNLTELISGLEGWPKLLTWQQIDIDVITRHGGVQDLMQAPVLFFDGAEDPNFTDEQVQLLRDYVTQGGFILGEAACTKIDFDRAFRELITRMYPEGDHKLKRLTAEHPVFRSEYLIDPDTTELWGVDVGCRTSIIYSPHDLACLWDKWMVVDPPKRSKDMKGMITKANHVGVNIIAYATGREPRNKLDQSNLLVPSGKQDQIERGLLQIAKLRHTGGWDSAPQAVRNLLTALNAYAGVSASTKVKNLPASDPNLFKYPLVYMHGRNRFQMTRQEQEQLREYVNRGGVLFADACCGAPQFDRSFRDLMEQMFPSQKLQRIPANHEMFTSKVGHDLPRVKRREPEANNPQLALRTNVVEGEPYLEGIEIDGRYVVIYSKYDISCALERQASVACTGYVYEDAVKIAVNVVLYSLLQ
jgi:hypothetical protein